MASALRDSGSTWRWRKLRAYYAAILPVTCSRCHELVYPNQAWDLDHVVPRAAGGNDSQVWPAHRLQPGPRLRHDLRTHDSWDLATKTRLVNDDGIVLGRR